VPTLADFGQGARPLLGLSGTQADSDSASRNETNPLIKSQFCNTYRDGRLRLDFFEFPTLVRQSTPAARTCARRSSRRAGSASIGPSRQGCKLSAAALR